MNREARKVPVPVMCGIVAFVVYASTAARAPQFGDGMELIATASVLGVPHPTGYPLLMMLFAPIAHGANAYFHATLMCGLFAAVAAGFITAIATEIFDEQHADAGAGIRAWLPAAFGLLVAFSASLWNSATVVEVYSLNAMFVAANLFLLLKHPARALSFQRLLLAAIILGLAGTNHITSLSMGALYLVRMVQSLRAGVLTAKSVVMLVLAGMCGLLPYAYIPIRAAADPAINWGDPDTFAKFLWVLRGGEYSQSHFLQTQPGFRMSLATWGVFFVQRTVLLLQALGSELLGGLSAGTTLLRVLLNYAVALMIVGLAAMGVMRFWRKSRMLAAAMMVTPMLQLVFIYTYNIPDITDYFLGLWITLSPFLVAGLFSCVVAFARRGGYLEHGNMQRRLLVVLCLACLVPLFANFAACNRAGNDLAQAYMERLQQSLPENALLLTTSEYDTFSAWYMQHVLGERRDVLVVTIQFLRIDWYQKMIPVAQPDEKGRLIQDPATGSFTEFDLYRYATLVERSAIAPNLGKVPVLITTGDQMVMQVLSRRHDFVDGRRLLADEELEWMMGRYPTVAPPLVFEVKAKQ